MPRFLNRLLALKTMQQNLIFKYFLDTYDLVVLDAKRTGKWDGPMRHIKGTNVTFQVTHLLTSTHMTHIPYNVALPLFPFDIISGPRIHSHYPLMHLSNAPL